MEKTKFSIAIMDEEQKERDLFVNFLEDEFNIIEIPYVATADELIERIKSDHIDAIAIDYKLKDHKSKFKENGDYFFKELMSRLHEFPSFVITQDSENAKNRSKLIKSRFIIDKEILHSQNNKEIKKFKDGLKQEIVAYKNIFDSKLKRLKELEKIRKSKGLKEDLENEYLKLNIEVSQSITGYDAIPLKYFSVETNKKLDEIITKTDELLNKLSGKN